MRRARPGQASRTETDDGRLRGSFWWGGRKIDGGRREQNRSSLHVSKGQPLPQYVLARCLQTGCTFRRKWTRLCFGGAVGSDRSDRAAVATTGRSASGSSHARVGKARPRRPVKSVSQSISQARSRGRIRVDKVRPWILDEGQVPADGRAALTDLVDRDGRRKWQSGNGEEWGGSRGRVQRVPLGRNDAEEGLEGTRGRSRRCRQCARVC